MPAEIRTEAVVPAAPDVVHDLLTDIGSWAIWSPHVASVKPRLGHVAAGDVIRTRAFFSPVATPMHVDTVTPGRGISWHSEALGHRLSYENRVDPAPEGARVTFTARIAGPAAGPLTLLTRPLSALGQRRRIARLGRLAALVEHERRQGSGPGGVSRRTAA